MGERQDWDEGPGDPLSGAVGCVVGVLLMAALVLGVMMWKMVWG